MFILFKRARRKGKSNTERPLNLDVHVLLLCADLYAAFHNRGTYSCTDAFYYSFFLSEMTFCCIQHETAGLPLDNRYSVGASMILILQIIIYHECNAIYAYISCDVTIKPNFDVSTWSQDHAI
uniref:Uncharacterized protein n=1 Tax=Oryza barthii TaxID=65489 RepID=A0A0D3H470_9ORYZ